MAYVIVLRLSRINLHVVFDSGFLKMGVVTNGRVSNIMRWVWIVVAMEVIVW